MSRNERSGWRDSALSKRHRLWGTDCPMVDIDFLAVEYNHRIPAALVDYKAHRPFEVDFKEDANFATLVNAANSMNIPFMVVFYSPRFWWFYVLPGNEYAIRFYGQAVMLSEFQYVSSLFQLRGISMPANLAAMLSRFNPMKVS